MPPDEVFVSVDIEASGASPSTGSLLALGACLVEDPSIGFYVELRPLEGLPWSDDAERVHGLALDRLRSTGIEPSAAVEQFAAWLAEVAAGRRPVFVGFNATFDWMFVADYFHRFLGSNPFGISGLDIKAYYMGRHRVDRWADTNRIAVAQQYGADPTHTHNALDDAREQAQLFRRIAAGE